MISHDYDCIYKEIYLLFGCESFNCRTGRGMCKSIARASVSVPHSVEQIWFELLDGI